MKKINLNVRVEEELKKEFYKKCEDNIQTPSVIIRKLLEEYTERGMDVFQKNNKKV